MATVRFSKELQEEIIKNAKAVFDKQAQAAREAKPDEAWGEKIYNILFGEHVPALNAVPQYFLNMTEKIKIEQVGDRSCNLEFKLNNPRPFPIPNEFPNMELAKKAGYYDNAIALKDNLVWSEFFAEVAKWQEGMKAVEEKRRVFVEQVEKIINAHATLAPALKMWQPLWDLIPEEYKERHRKIVEREKKEVNVDVDLQSLTATVVAHKITR
jgi:hypothetical protein